MDKKLFLESTAAVSGIHIPRWNELPEFDLYMDQVIGLAEKNLGALYIDGKGLLTPSMINNYVKSGVLPPPKNKKYNRTHLAILIIVCAMKPVMEISAVSDIIKQSVAAGSIEAVLDEFARMYENELASSIKKAKLAVETSHNDEILSFIAIENTLKASAARTVAMHAYRSIRAAAEPEKKAAPEKEPDKKKEPPSKSAPKAKKKGGAPETPPAAEEKSAAKPEKSE